MARVIWEICALQLVLIMDSVELTSCQRALSRVACPRAGASAYRERGPEISGPCRHRERLRARLVPMPLRASRACSGQNVPFQIAIKTKMRSGIGVLVVLTVGLCVEKLPRRA